MEKSASIEQILDNTNNSIIIKSKKSIVPGLVMSALGICTLIINSQIDTDPGSILPPLFLVTGITLFIWGIVSLFHRKPVYKSASDGKRISFYEIAFDRQEQKELLRLLAARDIKAVSRLKRSDSGGLKLRIAATPEGSICYTQAIAYIPHEYRNISEVYKHTPEEAKIIMALKENR